MPVSYIIFDKLTGQIKRSGQAPSVEMAEIQLSKDGDEDIVVGEDGNLRAIDDDKEMVDPVAQAVAAPSEASRVSMTGRLKNRPEMPLIVSKLSIKADGIDAITFSGYAVPSTLEVRGVASLTGSKIRLTDSEFVFTTEIRGEYKFLFRGFPYRRKEVTVAAT